MKSKKGISLPHPVIGLGDDVKGSFKIELKVYIIDQELIIKEKSVEINNDYFKSLFESNKITTAYRLKCSSTLYSIMQVGGIDLNISCTEISNSVDIESFLIACEDISNYSDSSFNPDSKLGENKGVYYVKKGSIIGDAGISKIRLDTMFVNGLAGIIEFKPIDIHLPISIDTDNPKIIVSYPKKEDDPDMITILSQKNSKYKKTFLSLFLIPALTKAFTDLIKADLENRYEEFLESYHWASAIDSLSDDFDNYEDPFELAQLFLKKVIEKKSNIVEPIPIVSSFNELNSFLNGKNI